MPNLPKTISRLDPANAVLIGEHWTGGELGTFDVEDPATCEVLAKVADAGPAAATRAVDSAAATFPTWRQTPPRERAELLRRVYELMIRDTEALAALISAENGKSVADARAEVAYAAEFFRWFGEEAVRIPGSYTEAPAGGARNLVSRRPIGVCALVTPWNFPAAMATRKIAPALAAGCTVVLRPASATPLTAFAIGRLLQEAGVPAGVINIVPSSSAGVIVGSWLTDPRVRMLSFTGSTPIGRSLLRQAADRILVTSMELGGNAPFIVLPDADLDAATAGAMIAKLRNGGQACTAANRFYVHASVADEFCARFGAQVEQLTVGPAATGANIGPLISARAVIEIKAKLDEAIAAGARIAHQAGLPAGLRGHFLAPCVVTDVPANARLVTEETFGPVAPIVAWDTEERLLELVNDCEYGLASYIYGSDTEHAMRIGEQIEAGMVGVNRGIVSDPSAPFGGMKQSGIGREGGHFGIDEFTEVQYLSIA